MTEASLISEDARRLIGTASDPGITEIEKVAIRRFADAVGDPNPLYRDEEYARRTVWGGIIAPPTFVYTLNRGSLPEVPLTVSRLLNGGDEFEYGVPIRPGDVIVAITRYADLYERSGRAGRMVFVVTETTYSNQHGKFVAKHRGTRIRY